MASMQTKSKQARRATRHSRVRAKIAGTAERPRLVVFKSNRYVYAQLIDDDAGVTLVAAHSRGSNKTQREQAKEVGAAIAKAAVAKKISAVTFDRGGFTFAGIIKEIADSARTAGLSF
jgi:large subunit ribosomal protein L18